MTQLKDLAERVVWTFIEAFLGVLSGNAALDLDMEGLEMAAVAGLGAVAAVLLVAARQRLVVLDTRQRPVKAPRRGDGGQAWLVVLASVAITLLILVVWGDDIIR